MYEVISRLVVGAKYQNTLVDVISVLGGEVANLSLEAKDRLRRYFGHHRPEAGWQKSILEAWKALQ